MTRSVALLRRWRAQPERRPRGRLSLAWHGAGPLVVNASWALLVLVWLPRALMPLTVLLIGVPDIGMLLVLSAAVAFGWGIIRTLLVFRALRTRAARPPAVQRI